MRTLSVCLSVCAFLSTVGCEQPVDAEGPVEVGVDAEKAQTSTAEYPEFGSAPTQADNFALDLDDARELALVEWLPNEFVLDSGRTGHFTHAVDTPNGFGGGVADSRKITDFKVNGCGLELGNRTIAGVEKTYTSLGLVPNKCWVKFGSVNGGDGCRCTFWQIPGVGTQLRCNEQHTGRYEQRVCMHTGQVEGVPKCSSLNRLSPADLLGDDY